MAKMIHTMIRVLDLEKSLKFYREAFDFVPSHTLDFPDFALVYLRNAENDIAMREHAFKQGQAVYAAAGAVKSFRTPPYPSTHNLGTCRMGSDAGNSVCNKFGQTHEIKNLFISDGSQFTTGVAENPTLTIVTLAVRQADYIARQMSARAI